MSQTCKEYAHTMHQRNFIKNDIKTTFFWPQTNKAGLTFIEGRLPLRNRLHTLVSDAPRGGVGRWGRSVQPALRDGLLENLLVLPHVWRHGHVWMGAVALEREEQARLNKKEEK